MTNPAVITPKVNERLPVWFRRSLPQQSTAVGTHEILGNYKLNTVCESARCPNRSECYANRTATFMILGNSCTRRCGFCSVPTGKGESIESDEPKRVALAAKELGLDYVVVTSVARDDLKDEGAGHFAQTIRAIKQEMLRAQVEVLTPDFHARRELLQIVCDAQPDVFNHNVETVRRLQKSVRAQAEYERSLNVLKTVKELDSKILTKSGIMLGLGERVDEVLETAMDLRSVGCDILTLGQYLAPGKERFYLKVERFVPPAEFDQLATECRKMGFRDVFAGPYVRSSYHAGEVHAHAQNAVIKESIEGGIKLCTM